MEPALIVVSRDFHFVRRVINCLKEEFLKSTIERSIGSDDFEALINELIDENLRVISIICDSNLSVNDLDEIQEVLKNYDSQIHYSLEFGFQMEDAYMD
jgi:hypothetical protein